MRSSRASRYGNLWLRLDMVTVLQPGLANLMLELGIDPLIYRWSELGPEKLDREIEQAQERVLADS